MLMIYAQAAPDARPRPSDRTLSSGERLQFIGARATKESAHDLARRESLRVNGIAIVYSLSVEPRLRATYIRGQLMQEIEPVAGSAVIELTPDENERFRANAARMFGMDVDAFTHAELPPHLRGKRNG